MYQPPQKYIDVRGKLTNGIYTIDKKAMLPHITGLLSTGKCQFLWRVNAESVVLDAAAYADEYNLWKGSQSNLYRAKILVVNAPIGVIAETGELTNYVNVYRAKLTSLEGRLTRLVHGCPGNSP